MNKILLIARREFLSRVQKKTFLLTTILLPLIIFIFYGMMIYFSVKTSSGLHISIVDNADVFGGKIENKDDITFEFLKAETPQSLNNKVSNKEIDGYVFVPSGYNPSNNDSITLVSAKTVGLVTRGAIQQCINNALEEHRLLSSLNVTKAQLDSLQKGNDIQFKTISGKDNNDKVLGISTAVGYISGFLIYIILFIYGTMVMRGVMEEKTNRIAEVIVSSVKPFQLMLGKITGIGAVGLVQFIIWIVLITGLNILLPVIFPGIAEHMASQPVQPPGAQAMQAVKSSGMLHSLMGDTGTVNFSLIIGCFIFYFIGGYLLYSSLFAAIGSAVNEDPQDAQSLMLPVTMPIIFAIVIMTKAVNDPNSGLALFGSLFPLTSPIVMMARIPFGVPNTVPYWQLAASMLFLIAGFLLTTWLSAKIYRTGILMYGKKVTWKEMWKWAFRKN
jgi:ABC-2 type transport system permease protein